MVRQPGRPSARVAILALAGLVLLLDGVDGWLARRGGWCSRFGARFDMETDALLVLLILLVLLFLTGPLSYMPEAVLAAIVFLIGLDLMAEAGFDPRAQGFFWLAGQGGYGVQSSPAMAALTRHLVTGAALGGDFAGLERHVAEIAPQRLLPATPG